MPCPNFKCLNSILFFKDAFQLYAGDVRTALGEKETASIFTTFPTPGISQGIGFLDQVNKIQLPDNQNRESSTYVVFRLPKLA